MAMDPSQAVPAALSQGWGYGVTLGFGFAFAIGMIGVTHLLKKFNGEDNSEFEYYATAGRNVGTGLTATAVISSWGWSTALLSSSVVAYNYGVGGSWWFAGGCLVQICLFAVLAIQSKLKTPHAHTVLEVVRVRYGRTAHWVYMFLCLINNLIAVCNMLLGASAAISALTGMSTIAANFLLPTGVCLYTITGGLKATFITDWLHTVALLLIVVYLSIKTVTNPYLNEGGGLDRFYELLVQAGQTSPVSGNQNGSYLTMTSKSAVEFGILHTLGNFGLVVMDSSYWQKAYSADIAAAVPGYIIGGILYFGFVWALGTVAGLGGVALTSNPAWPAFGRMLNESELANGLVLPYSTQVVAGKGGAVAVVIVIFMAVTSTTSAQLVAVSSIISSDVYHTYIRPDASEKDVINVSRWACVGFAIFAAGFSTMLFEIGLSLTWTLYFLGIIVCPGGLTLVWTVLWKKQTREAAIISPLVGMAAGLATWLAVSNHRGNGVISVATTGDLLSCLYGTIVSAFLPAILSPIISYLRPSDDFAWEKFSEIKLISDQAHKAGEEEGEAETVINSETEAISPEQRAFMERQTWIAGGMGAFLYVGIWIIWPFAMYGSKYEFSLPFFRGWIITSIIWAFIALLFVFFVPPIQGRHVIFRLVRGLLSKDKNLVFKKNQRSSKRESGSIVAGNVRGDGDVVEKGERLITTPPGLTSSESTSVNEKTA
ncbi:unnamed protein product [Tilletia laevis]|uniref:Urea active transporter n=2 Tax=Tilletia TaxID=13289 RepID=A0A177UE46_9BASI|nr:hypothetical protein CF335_g2194 [Tilletia laevis]KAE8262575.1 hypothetical protein A4X03_0g2350 [Tilletia caries]CAD6922086.1 unnamed protein product [Tilletia controversa]CAD6893757.1 unnamed protein product [Tilletia caries]CAD6903083.1 unnamed protein product [Tilletia laevis]